MASLASLAPKQRGLARQQEEQRAMAGTTARAAGVDVQTELLGRDRERRPSCTECAKQRRAGAWSERCQQRGAPAHSPSCAVKLLTTVRSTCVSVIIKLKEFRSSVLSGLKRARVPSCDGSASPRAGSW